MLARPRPFGEGGLAAHSPSPRPSGGRVGPIVGAAIIVVLMIFGALYFWGSYLNQQDQQNNSAAAALQS